MAERRMFSKSITDSDAFLDMPMSTQCLYFHLCMRADDEGFINNPRRIQRMVGATEDDLKLLFAKQFIIPFESGVVVIKHWKIHNYIRADRLVETKYTDERQHLAVGKNGEYTKTEKSMSVSCQSDVSQLSATCPSNVSIGKDSIGKYSIGKGSIGEIEGYGEEENQPKTGKKDKKRYGQYQNVLLSDSEYAKLQHEYPGEFENVIAYLDSYFEEKANAGKYKSHYLTIKRWVIDAVREKKARERKNGEPAQSSFDTDDFFAAALAKSYGNGEQQ